MAKFSTHREDLAQLPPWTDEPLARLEHTLAAYAEAPDNRWALYATSCTHPEPGDPQTTGITYGDLRAILAELRAARATMAANTVQPGVVYGERYGGDDRIYAMPGNWTEQDAIGRVMNLREMTGTAELFRMTENQPGEWVPVPLPEEGPA